MPGIDFDRLRTEITIEQVLSLIGFAPTRCRGDQWYGRCPLEGSTSRRADCFSVNVSLGRYHCHHCGSRGNPLELWSAFTKKSLHPAAIELCHALGRDIPWIHRW